MLITTNAIVLKRFPYSNSSLICRLFTKNNGKITILSKGALRTKKSVTALLEPINHIQVQYFHKETREIQILREVEFIQHFSRIREKLNRTMLALAVIEFIDMSTQNTNPDPILFRLSWRILEKLNNHTLNHWIIFAFFLYQFSLRIGFMPNLKNCNLCNREMQKGGLNKSSGELVCQHCITNLDSPFIKLDTLKQLKSAHLDELNNLIIEDTDVIDSIQLLNIFLSYHIHSLNNVKSLRILENISNL